jgi:hypothetical protein
VRAELVRQAVFKGLLIRNPTTARVNQRCESASAIFHVMSRPLRGVVTK